MNAKTKDHHEGFEHERLFRNLIHEMAQTDPSVRIETIKRIVRHFAPDLIDGLFQVRRCRRQLRYIGGKEDLSECARSFFHPGDVYWSRDFTGATYGIEGYTPEGNTLKRMSCDLFERID